MRPFYLYRNEDETGISGTGIVMEGVEFTDGRCALVWQSDRPSGVVSPNIEAVQRVHGHGGKSAIISIPIETKELTELRPRIFYLNHTENKFGLTREGTVAECALFSNKWVVMRWLVKPYTIEFHCSCENFVKIHASQAHAYITYRPSNLRLNRTIDSFLSEYRWYRDFVGGDWYFIRSCRLHDCFIGWVRFPGDADVVFDIEAR